MISSADVKKAARLAKLKMSEEESEKYTEQLTEIMGFIDKLDQLDTQNIIATSHAVESEAPFRNDEVKENSVIESILEQAPEAEERFFTVPRVI